MEVIKYNQPNAFNKKPLKQQSEFIADTGEQRSEIAISYMVWKTKDE